MVYDISSRLIKEGAFLDVTNIRNCLEDFFGDITFEEAYQRTGNNAFFL